MCIGFRQGGAGRKTTGVPWGGDNGKTLSFGSIHNYRNRANWPFENSLGPLGSEVLSLSTETRILHPWAKGHIPRVSTPVWVTPTPGWGAWGHGKSFPSYREAWGTCAAPGDAVAVSAVLTGARQPAAVAVVASRAGLVAVLARPAWLAGACSSDWVAAEQMREESEDILAGEPALSHPPPTPSLVARVAGSKGLRLNCLLPCQKVPKSHGLNGPKKLGLTVII